MAETERTLHDELVRDLTRVVREADEMFEREGGSSRHWVRDCFLPDALPVFERHFRARLLGDEAVEAMIPVLEDRAAEFFYQRADYEPDAARAALSAALDHVSGPEGGESRE
jgi:hypothetical protein